MIFSQTMMNTKMVYDSIYRAGKPDGRATLESWRRDCVLSHSALQELKNRLDEKEMELSEIYTSKAVQEIMHDSRESFGDIVRDERRRLTARLDEILDAKMEQYKSVALSAPSDEQIRLLTALSLRDDLTETEVSEIAAANAGSFQFLRSLKSVAGKAGIDIPAPPGVEQINDQLGDARQYGTDSLRDLDVSDSEMGYFSRLFYSAQECPPQLKSLDGLIFTAPQETADGHEPS